MLQKRWGRSRCYFLWIQACARSISAVHRFRLVRHALAIAQDSVRKTQLVSSFNSWCEHRYTAACSIQVRHFNIPNTLANTYARVDTNCALFSVHYRFQFRSTYLRFILASWFVFVLLYIWFYTQSQWKGRAVRRRQRNSCSAEIQSLRGLLLRAWQRAETPWIYRAQFLLCWYHICIVFTQRF